MIIGNMAENWPQGEKKKATKALGFGSFLPDISFGSPRFGQHYECTRNAASDFSGYLVIQNRGGGGGDLQEEISLGRMCPAAIFLWLQINVGIQWNRQPRGFREQRTV